MGKVDTQILSEPHLPGLFVAYKERRGKQNLLGIQNGLVKSFSDHNRHYSFTYYHQSANVFIYRFIHFQIHLFIYSFTKSFIHIFSDLLSELSCIDAAFWRSSSWTANLRIRKRNSKIKLWQFKEQDLYRIATFQNYLLSKRLIPLSEK